MTTDTPEKEINERIVVAVYRTSIFVNVLQPTYDSDNRLSRRCSRYFRVQQNSSTLLFIVKSTRSVLHCQSTCVTSRIRAVRRRTGGRRRRWRRQTGQESNETAHSLDRRFH